MKFSAIFKLSTFYTFLWYGASLLLLRFDNGGALFNGKVRSSLIDFDVLARLPTLEIFAFITVQILCLVTIAYLIATLSLPLIKSRVLEHSGILVVSFVSIIVGAGFIAINDYFFPHSNHPLRLADTEDVIDGGTLSYQLIVVSILFLLGYAFFYYLKNKTKASVVISVLLIFSVVVLSSETRESSAKVNFSSAKNVFLIGVDSLRADAFEESDRRFSKAVPTISSFVRNSLHYSNTLTPQARTYAAWVSLLTGRYPMESGARFNLIGAERVSFLEESLAFKMADLGYQTVFATDERRYSNIGRNEGFQEIVGPIMGASDFLIGTLSNNPFLNWLWLSPLGERLLPHSALNRAVAHSYMPDRFNRAIASKLNELDTKAPVFMATHFCLAHYPYYDLSSDPALSSKSIHERYISSLNGVDEMLRVFLGDLKRRGLLNNALVIVFSDHGEAFPSLLMEEQGVSFHDLIFGRKDRSFGHGTDVFDEAQYKVLLAIQEFRNGRAVFEPKYITEPVSLIDVTPTVLARYGIDKSYKGKGYDLLSKEFLDNGSSRLMRYRFLEDGFTPKSLLSGDGDLNEAAILAESAKYYTVSDEGRLQLSAQYLPELIASKQLAVEFKFSLLAYLNGQFYFREKGDDHIVSFVMDTQKKRNMLIALCEHFHLDTSQDDTFAYSNCQNARQGL